VTLRVELSPYGEPALRGLGQLIEEYKGGDPLRPVTVVVARSAIGLGTRRALAAGVSASGRPGVTNVNFDTLAGWADTIAGATLAAKGRLPLTDAVLRASVRAALDQRPDSLLGVTRDHPSTVDALMSTYRELRPVGAPAWDRLAGSSARAAEVVEVLRAARDRTGAWFDEVDVFEEAISLLRAGPASAALGAPVILYLPTVLPAHQAELVRQCAAHVPCAAIIGVTGDEKVDELSRRLVAALDLGRAPTPMPPVEVSRGDAVLSAPSADAEVLLVVRDLMERCERGTPLERMAIVHSGASGYVTLLHNALRRAGIPFNGGGVRPLSSTVAGRMLLGCLGLPDHDWRREDVAAWLSTGPLVDGGADVPAARWDLISAEAGVTEGLDGWHDQLEKEIASLRAEAGELDPDDDGARRQSLLAEARYAEQLMAFIHRMASQLESVPRTWRRWASWAKDLLHGLVGGSAAFDSWPPDERAAAQAVEEAIDGLAVLEQLDAEFSPAAARAALEAELEVPAPQTSRFGVGVWVAPLSSVVGHRLDVLYVVGMNDGVFPGAPSDDVLIPDRERAGADEGIALRGSRALAMRRDYLAALAGASTRLLSFPRGNQRDGRDLRPSRWLLDTLGHIVGSPERIYANELDSIPATEGYRIDASFLSAVASAGAPTSTEDRDLRSLLHWTSSGRRLSDHFLCGPGTALARGVELLEGRRAGFNRFDGNVAAVLAGRDLVPSMLSATRLEAFAQCPRRYFFESVLRIEPRPTDERSFATDRLERGTLMHSILERYVDPLLDQTLDDGSDLFGAERLLATAAEEMDRFEAEGRAGPRAVWEMEKVQIRRQLRAFAESDARWRRASGAVTVAVEQTFGIEGSDPVAVAVPGGLPVQFRGRIDRVDRTADGTRVVIDYKSGSSLPYRGDGDDHYQRGTALQLAVYAAAVSGDGPGQIRSEYWFVSERGSDDPLGYDLTADESDNFGRVVGTLTDTMSRGLFPANPEPTAGQKKSPCDYCPYKKVCPDNRVEVWARSKADPALSGYVGLEGK
jgi:ATP-dependent helicase/nuclease subunit B